MKAHLTILFAVTMLMAGACTPKPAAKVGESEIPLIEEKLLS